MPEAGLMSYRHPTQDYRDFAARAQRHSHAFVAHEREHAHAGAHALAHAPAHAHAQQMHTHTRYPSPLDSCSEAHVLNSHPQTVPIQCPFNAHTVPITVPIGKHHSAHYFHHKKRGILSFSFFRHKVMGTVVFTNGNCNGHCMGTEWALNGHCVGVGV